MKIIYASTFCETDYINNLMGANPKLFGHQVQKYHKLLIEGLSKSDNVTVESISAPPITPSNYNGIYISQGEHIVKNVTYHYLPICNLRIVKNIVTTVSSFIKCMSIRKGEKTVMIGDVLNISVSLGALLACKVRNIPTIGIVTDIPAQLNANKTSWSVRFSNWMMNRFSSYLLLTEAMNDIVNPNNKPYVVIEGQVDVTMSTVSNQLVNKYSEKVCIYAGSLHKIYGIQYLTDGFVQANIENSQLHIYGTGDFLDELLQICEDNQNIHYMGEKPNEYIVQEELKATLLINPRPSNEEYTKYSFPSKNMEYMVSATPILTTKLPGMPKEYDNFVYLIETESATGLANTLIELLSKDRVELHQFGLMAKKFVLQEKNNVVQSKKILKMIEGTLYAQNKI